MVAETNDEIVEMVSNCNVLLALAGPYVLCGEKAGPTFRHFPRSLAGFASSAHAGPDFAHLGKVVKACIEHKTHYVDITGEVTWMHRIIQRYHDAAKESGVWDLTPFQLGTTLSSTETAKSHLPSIGDALLTQQGPFSRGRH